MHRRAFFYLVGFSLVLSSSLASAVLSTEPPFNSFWVNFPILFATLMVGFIGGDRYHRRFFAGKSEKDATIRNTLRILPGVIFVVVTLMFLSAAPWFRTLWRMPFVWLYAFQYSFLMGMIHFADSLNSMVEFLVGIINDPPDTQPNGKPSEQNGNGN